MDEEKCFYHNVPLLTREKTMAYLIPKTVWAKSFNKIYQDLSEREISGMNIGRMPSRTFHHPEEGFCEERFISWG